MHEVATSRRDAMRSLAILPAIIAMPAVASAAPMLVCATADQIADARAWNAAMTHYLKAKADGETFDRERLGPQFEAARAKFGEERPFKGQPGWAEYKEWCEASGFSSVMKQWDDMAKAEGDAHVALLKIPAPDMPALRWKLEQTFDDDGEIALWSEKIALTIRSDFQRLLIGESVA